MTKAIYILLLVVCSCNLAQDNESNRGYVFNILQSDDNVTFPIHYEVLQEKDTVDSKKRLYCASCKLSHDDILIFVSRNKLIPADTTHLIFFPSTLMFIDEKPELHHVFELKTPNGLELYADTIQDKVFISRYYN